MIRVTLPTAGWVWTTHVADEREAEWLDCHVGSVVVEATRLGPAPGEVHYCRASVHPDEVGDPYLVEALIRDFTRHIVKFEAGILSSLSEEDV